MFFERRTTMGDGRWTAEESLLDDAICDAGYEDAVSNIGDIGNSLGNGALFVDTEA